MYCVWNKAQKHAAYNQSMFKFHSDTVMCQIEPKIKGSGVFYEFTKTHWIWLYWRN